MNTSPEAKQLVEAVELMKKPSVKPKTHNYKYLRGLMDNSSESIEVVRRRWNLGHTSADIANNTGGALFPADIAIVADFGRKFYNQEWNRRGNGPGKKEPVETINYEPTVTVPAERSKVDIPRPTLKTLLKELNDYLSNLRDNGTEAIPHIATDGVTIRVTVRTVQEF